MDAADRFMEWYCGEDIRQAPVVHFAVDATTAACGYHIDAPAIRNCDASKVTCDVCKKVLAGVS